MLDTKHCDAIYPLDIEKGYWNISKETLTTGRDRYIKEVNIRTKFSNEDIQATRNRWECYNRHFGIVKN